MARDDQPPVGPKVDATPRPLPPRVAHRGAVVDLEPLHVRHATELFRAAQGQPGGHSWAYLGYGPFAAEAAMRAPCRRHGHAPTTRWPGRCARTHRHRRWLADADGDLQPGNAPIEIGNIWFSPRMQRHRAATEAMFLLMRHAMDDLGYRRLIWKCNALNMPSRRAAERLGFIYEGDAAHIIVTKGRRRDTAWFSIIDEEWPARRDAIAGWLDDGKLGRTTARPEQRLRRLPRLPARFPGRRRRICR